MFIHFYTHWVSDERGNHSRNFYQLDEVSKSQHHVYLNKPPRPVGIARRSFQNLRRPLLVNHDCCCLSIQCFISECYLQFSPTNKIGKSHHHIHQPNGAPASPGGCEEVLSSSTAEVIESWMTFLVGHDYYCLLIQCFMPEISQENIPTMKSTTTTTTTMTSVSSSMPMN